MANVDIKTLLDGNDIFEEFKGSLAEQYVCQELIAQRIFNIHYYANENSTSKIEFIIDNGLDIIPIESIPDKISLQLYDQRIIRYQISLALDWKKRQIQWIKTPPVWSNDRLFRQVSKSCSSIRQISYSLYSHPSDTTYIVCAESVSEMPEGKFCRLGNFDQWFSVQDVQDLKEEHPMSQVAYVSLVLDDWIPRKESGNIRINSDKIGRTIPYVYLYCEGNNVVIRVEDSVSAAFLADKANVADIKESPSCQFNGKGRRS